MADLLLVEAGRELKGEEKTDVPPLGLAYIAAVAEEEGFSVEIIDLNIKDEDPGDRIDDAGMAGVSFYTHNYDRAISVLEDAKARGKSVIAGGPHATPLYKDILADGFDIVVRGEGEYPVRELLRRDGNPKGIRGLAYLENGRAVANGVWRVEDLDLLPLPARHLLDLEKYSFPGAIATSRGCAHSCIFCSSRNQSGTLRLRSAGTVVEEIYTLRELGMRSFLVVDPNFAHSKGRVLEICDGIRDAGMEWYAELRLDHLDDELIKAMATAGCRVVRFGIESGSQRVVDAIRKGISLSMVERMVKALVDNGITPVCGFMVGHPNESKMDFEATLRLVERIRELGGEATFAVQTPYPGTYLYRNAAKLGIDILHHNWSSYQHLNPVISTREFTAGDLEELLRAALRRIGAEKKRRSFRSIAKEKQGKTIG